MQMQWRKYFITINEIYGDPKGITSLKKSVIDAYFQQSEPVQTPKKNVIHRQALHLCIDLTKTEEVLMREMDKTTRYKIRRAERDKVTVSNIKHPDTNDIKEFARFYNSFAKVKGIAACKLNKLIGLMENNMLMISYVYHEDGRILASTATITNKGTAIGLYGASGRFAYQDLSGQFISRANRYLHWQEMMYFKQLGYHTFDMMGLTKNKNDIGHQKINDYKKGFGGEEKIVYQSFIPRHMVGVCVIWALKFMWRNNPDVIRNNQPSTMEYAKGKEG